MYRKILVVIFGTELSMKAVKEAAQLAKALEAKLLILHVRSPLDVPHHPEGGALSRNEQKISEEIDQEEHKFLDGAVELATSAGVQPETAFTEALEPYEGIIRVSQEQHCDLIVMGTRIRHGIPGYLVKSETQQVLAHSSIPVLVVR